MVWGAISSYSVSELKFLTGTQDSRKYCETLELGVLPKTAERFGTMSTQIFQQDNASIYRSNYTRNCLYGHQVCTLPWTAKSPELNIIDNVWGLMIRKVYVNGNQLDSVEDLKESIVNIWLSQTAGYMQKLFRSIPRRLLSLMDTRGSATRY